MRGEKEGGRERCVQRAVPQKRGLREINETEILFKVQWVGRLIVCSRCRGCMHAYREKYTHFLMPMSGKLSSLTKLQHAVLQLIVQPTELVVSTLTTHNFHNCLMEQTDETAIGHRFETSSEMLHLSTPSVLYNYGVRVVEKQLKLTSGTDPVI